MEANNSHSGLKRSGENNSRPLCFSHGICDADKTLVIWLLKNEYFQSFWTKIELYVRIIEVRVDLNGRSFYFWNNQVDEEWNNVYSEG